MTVIRRLMTLISGFTSLAVTYILYDFAFPFPTQNFFFQKHDPLLLAYLMRCARNFFLVAREKRR